MANEIDSIWKNENGTWVKHGTGVAEEAAARAAAISAEASARSSADTMMQGNINALASSKQDKLIPGENITIAADGKTISASGFKREITTYTSPSDLQAIINKINTLAIGDQIYIATLVFNGEKSTIRYVAFTLTSINSTTSVFVAAGGNVYNTLQVYRADWIDRMTFARDTGNMRIYGMYFANDLTRYEIDDTLTTEIDITMLNMTIIKYS